ncbi:MAG: helix-turn-helix domain-containing protein, partial [Bdellovibrionales bacterium]|nr:helix-turn-helix domain-containing protein [Bdellovibrionales bacterium]
MGNRRSSNAVTTRDKDGFIISPGKGSRRTELGAGTTENLARGLEILECFDGSGDRQDIAQISKKIGLPKNSASRFAYTLITLGYLNYDESDKTYGLGVNLLVLARPLLSRSGIINVLRPIMENLAEEFRCTVAIGQPADSSMIYINVVRGINRVGLDIGVGHTVPIASSAMGRAYLTTLDDTERNEVQKRLVQQSGVNETKLRSIIKDAKRSMAEVSYCTTLGEVHPDVNAAAVPLIVPGQ